jgi:Asp/Glu/hydantoin racemase
VPVPFAFDEKGLREAGLQCVEDGAEVICLGCTTQAAAESQKVLA